MEILADVRVWQDGGRSEDTTIKITQEDLEKLVEDKALNLIEGVSSSTINIEMKCNL